MDLKKEKNFFETRVIEYQNGGALTWEQQATPRAENQKKSPFLRVFFCLRDALRADYASTCGGFCPHLRTDMGHLRTNYAWVYNGAALGTDGMCRRNGSNSLNHRTQPRYAFRCAKRYGNAWSCRPTSSPA
jgi:hypothetical protein